MPETVSRDGIKQQTVEQIPDAPVPQAVEELADISKVSSQDGIQQRIVEQTIPAILLAEKIVELPVIQTEERTQQGVNTHAQHVVNTERPEIIKQTGQKNITQEKINQITSKLRCLSRSAPTMSWTSLSWRRDRFSRSKLLPVVDVSVVVVAQVPQVHVETKTVEITQLQHVVEKSHSFRSSRKSLRLLSC